MENELTITNEQFESLIRLSGIEMASNTEEDAQTLVSRAIIAIEQKLNFYNFPMSFFTAETINVLIVDDTELSIFQLSTMLKKIGMNVYVARTKEVAYAEFKKKNFDFLVLDLYMPDYKDGFDLIKEAHRIRNEENRDFKIICVSGTDNPDIVQEAYKLEIDEFIPKAPRWHEKLLMFISNSANKIANDEYTRFYVNDNICVLTLYKVNSEKYVSEILKEVNTNVMTNKYNIIFNMEHIKIFSDAYTNLFSEVCRAVSAKEGTFAIVKASEDIKKALEYVFLSDAVPVFDTLEEAVDFVEMNNINF